MLAPEGGRTLPGRRTIRLSGARLCLIVVAILTLVALFSSHPALAAAPLIAGLLLVEYCSYVEAQLRAQARRERWYQSTERMLRNAPRYPGDWRLRRVEVFLRASGKCESCGEPTGQLKAGILSNSRTISPEKAWHFEHTNVRHAHVHHKVEISKGGSHSLSNLELLCDECHAAKHPANSHLQNFRANTERQRRRRSVYLGNDATIKRARKEWVCFICERTIPPGEEYFGGAWAKVCLECKEKLGHRR
jgi:5-methylcytosine-specific restriction endonuclease McrA